MNTVATDAKAKEYTGDTRESYTGATRRVALIGARTVTGDKVARAVDTAATGEERPMGLLLELRV